MIDATAEFIRRVPVLSGRISSTISTANDLGSLLVPLEGPQLLGAALAPVKSGLKRLGDLCANWDRNGSEKPNSVSILRAAALAEEFYGYAAQSGYDWEPPHISANENGDVSFEWWRGEHKLTIYIEPGNTRFIKVWGPDVELDMADGEIVGARFAGLWRWLNAA